MSCSAMLGGSSSWSHFVMAMYSLQSGCVSRTSATCIIKLRRCCLQGGVSKCMLYPVLMMCGCTNIWMMSVADDEHRISHPELQLLKALRVARVKG